MNFMFVKYQVWSKINKTYFKHHRKTSEEWEHKICFLNTKRNNMQRAEEKR